MGTVLTDMSSWRACKMASRGNTAILEFTIVQSNHFKANLKKTYYKKLGPFVFSLIDFLNLCFEYLKVICELCMEKR